MSAPAVYTDFQSLAALHGVTGPAESQRLDDVAGQFASVFTHMMLKSMRQASLGEGIFDSQQSLFYRDMFDQQLALSLSDGEGVGIKQMIADHLRDVTGLEPPAAQKDTAAGQERRARAAYAAVAAMGNPQEVADTADKGDSRNTLQPNATDGAELRWRGPK